MNRYETMFDELRKQNEGAFVPFVVIGDPDIDRSLDIIRALVEGGADALELGIPFSDPVADGPVIQAATARAIESGTNFKRCFDAIAKLRSEGISIPIGILTYANIACGDTAAFYEAASAAGVDSMLLADVPAFEIAPFAKAAKAKSIHQVMIVPPDSSEDMLKTIAKLSGGYSYVLTRAGVTGANDDISIEQRTIVKRLSEIGAPPSLFGFGISRPEHVHQALEAGAAGAISGSAVVKIVEAHEGKELFGKLIHFVRDMKRATLYKE